jgi:signal transduction histidine kinase
MDRRDKLIEAGVALASELSLSALLQRIVDLAVEITEARYGALGVLGPDGRLAEFITAGITEEEREAIGDPPVGRGILGLLMKEARPIRISDISAHPSSVGFPKHHPRMTSLLGTPIVSHGNVFGDLYLTDKHGGTGFTTQDEEAIVVLAAQASVAIENAHLYEETRRREAWLDGVREIATAILAGASTDESLRLIARRARELVGADLATIAIPDVTGTQLMILAVDGAHAEELRGSRLPLSGSISGQVIRERRAAVLEDVAADERAYQPVVQLGNLGPAILIPLLGKEEVFGTLQAANLHGGRTFGPDDVRLLETFADQAALVLEYARTQREVLRVAVLEDRERIAKELHDGVIQALFAVGMGLEGAALMSDDGDLAQRIEGAVAEIDRAIRDLRNYIFGLRPGILADRELDQALHALAQEFQDRTGIVTVADVDERVAAEIGSRASDVLQAAREALSNVGRHAQATTCRLSLHRDGDRALLEIDDDGKGFDPTATRRGDGLTNLENRAEALGGEASIESSPTQGTTVRIHAPL